MKDSCPQSFVHEPGKGNALCIKSMGVDYFPNNPQLVKQIKRKIWLREHVWKDIIRHRYIFRDLAEVFLDSRASLSWSRKSHTHLDVLVH